MATKWSTAILTGAMALGMGSAAIAEVPGSSTADVQALRAEVAQLRAEQAQLRAAQTQDWMTERRAEEIKGLVHEVLSDADTRATLLQDGLTAGHDGKFFLASTDGGFRLNVEGQIQTRYIWSSRDDGTGEDINEEGFQMRRIKVKFNGHVDQGRKFTYKITLASDRDSSAVDGDVYVEDAIVATKLTDGVSIYMGRGKSPFSREELTSSSRQQMVERSVVGDFFTVGRSEGVGLKGAVGDNVKWNVFVNDGFRAGDFNARADFARDATDFAATGRVDLLLAGDWKQMKDFTSWEGEELAIFLGAAGHYEIGEGDGTDGRVFNGTITDSFYSWTIDGSVESNGLSVFAAFYGRHTDATNTGGMDLDQYGFQVQGAYNIGDKFEPFVRYEWADADTTAEELGVITAGFNYFIKKHKAKATLDVVYGLDEIDAAFGPSSGAGLTSDAPGEDSQVVVRGQVQLLF